MKKFLLAVVLAAIPALACAADLEISGAFMRASPMMAQSGAGFVTITNATGSDDTLLGAEAGISKTVELHTHIKDGEVMRMRQVASIPVPSGGAAELKPGGDHIMFIGLNRQLKEGEVIPVTLVFEKAGKKLVEMPVQGMGAMAPGAMMPGGMKQ